jgi:hypothetical protein
LFFLHLCLCLCLCLRLCLHLRLRLCLRQLLLQLLQLSPLLCDLPAQGRGGSLRQQQGLRRVNKIQS